MAQRIIHHYHTRPGLSLGVVSFSQAQAYAIETALGEARQQRPGLDRYFTTGCKPPKADRQDAPTPAG